MSRSVPAFSGYSLWSRLGSLSEGPSYELGDARGRVLALMDYGDGLLLVLSKSPSTDFSLWVDGHEFVASQSMVPQLAGSARFWWPLNRVLFPAGEAVEVSMRLAADGSSLAARAAAPPWARLQKFPVSHDGDSSFEVNVNVSEPVGADSSDVADAVRVIGGVLDSVSRHDHPWGELWSLQVTPDGDEDVTVWLDTSQGCAALGWWCTADGREVHNSPQVTITGPSSLTRLASLEVVGHDLDQAFSSARSLHTAWVPDGVGQVTVEVVAAHPAAKVSFAPADSDAAVEGYQVDLEAGAQQVVTVTVTAGAESATHWLVIDHGGVAADTDDDESPSPAEPSGLSGLALDGTDPISFDPETHRYEVAAPDPVAGATDRVVTVVAARQHTDATVEVLVVHGDDLDLTWDSQDADPDTEGHQITLADRGDTLVLIRVTSADAQHQQIYAVLIQAPRTSAPVGSGSSQESRQSLSRQFAGFPSQVVVPMATGPRCPKPGLGELPAVGAHDVEGGHPQAQPRPAGADLAQPRLGRPHARIRR